MNIDLQRHVTSRDRRQAVAENHQAALTGRLRALAGSGMELRDAATVVQRYARGFMGVHLDAAGAEAVAQIALSPAAAALEVEALDDCIMLMGDAS